MKKVAACAVRLYIYAALVHFAGWVTSRLGWSSPVFGGFALPNTAIGAYWAERFGVHSVFAPVRAVFGSYITSWLLWAVDLVFAIPSYLWAHLGFFLVLGIIGTALTNVHLRR